MTRTKKLVLAMRQYPIFTFVLLCIVIGLGLQIAGLQTAANTIIIIAAAVAAFDLIKGMVETVKEGGLGLDILALTAIIVGVLLQEYWASVVIALMLTGGEALEDYAERRATKELTGLLERAPKRAHLKGQDGKITEVAIETVKVGDTLLVKPGEVIPVDAQIIKGTTSIDESSLTGESLPISKTDGQQLMSGAVNLDASITIKALRTSSDSQYEQIIKLVKEATTAKSPFVRLADRYSVPFTVISFAIAFTAWGLSGDVLRFLQVIVVATPCPLLIGAPVAIISGMSRAAKHGIIIKNGKSLERLASIKSIAFDKTGTLTKGKPTVEKIHPYAKMTRDELLGLAAAIESHSNHILAQAVVTTAHDQGVKPQHVEDVTELPGKGLKASWKGQQVMLGNYAFFEEEQINFPDDDSTPKSAEHCETKTFVAVDNQVVGCLSFADEIRPEAKATVEKLRTSGLQHVLMLTGDNKTVAQNIASQVGITEIYSGLLPADKVSGLKNIEPSYRPSGMVGDGVNDAPVLAASDVGIALGARGATAASESADVVIMLDDLGRVAQAVDIAKRTIRIGLQSILIGIVISIGLMLVFSTGHFPAVLGAGLQEVVDVVVIINALRAHGNLSQTLFSKVKKAAA